MLGRMYGSRCVSFICALSTPVFVSTYKTCQAFELTSSSSEGSILRVRSPSVNLSRTLVKPFMNEIFSSRVLAAKFDRSRKFSVETGRDEKKGCNGRSVGEGRSFGCRVTREFSSAIAQSDVYGSAPQTDHTSEVLFQSFHTRQGLASVLA